MNPAAYPILYGIAGNMTPGKAVAAALLLVAASGAVSRLAARSWRRPAGTAPVTGGSREPAHARARAVPGLRADALSPLAAALGFAALLTGLTLAGYLYLTRGFA